MRYRSEMAGRSIRALYTGRLAVLEALHVQQPTAAYCPALRRGYADGKDVGQKVDEAAGKAKGKVEEGKGKAKAFAEEKKPQAEGAAEEAKDKASSTTRTVSKKASDAAESVKKGAQDAYKKAKDAVSG